MSKVLRKQVFILCFFSWDGKEQLTCVTWVTFSVTFCVRSLILLGAMISISVGEGGLIRSEPNVRVTCGMRPIVRCLIRSESEVEFRVLGLRSTTQNNSISSQVKKNNLWKSRLNRKREEYDWNLYKRKRFLMKYFPWERRWCAVMSNFNTDPITDRRIDYRVSTGIFIRQLHRGTLSVL